MEPLWKTFQDLVARIEKIAADCGATIRSPDRLVDMATGGDREVDASIRQRIGLSNVLITVECRRRADAEDVTWIEQLATKRESIGAVLTIAVSAVGFSRSAIALAARKSIVLRCLTDLSDEEIELLLTPVLQVTPHVEILAVGFRLVGSACLGSLSDFPEPLRRALEQDGWCETPLLRQAATAEGISLNAALKMALRPEGLRPFDGVPEDGTSVVKRMRLEVPAGVLQVDTTAGPNEVALIIMDVKLHVTRTPVSPAVAVRYQGMEHPSVITHSEYETPDERGGVRFTLQHNDAADKPALGVEIRDPSGRLHPAKLEHIRGGRFKDGKFEESPEGGQRVRFLDP